MQVRTSSRYLSVPIEPLIGHLRHPYGVCVDPQSPKVLRCLMALKAVLENTAFTKQMLLQANHLMDMSYLLINAWPPHAVMANYPGRR